MHESLISADGTIQSQWFVCMGTDTSGTVMAAYGDSSLVDSATIFDTPLLWAPREWGQPGDMWEIEAGALGGTFYFLVEDTAHRSKDE